jgi:electron transfer flavoprotein alpha subunit
MSEGWGFADIYSMEDDRGATTKELADIVSDEWRNILVLGRATGRTVFPETLSLVGHARYLADQLGCRVEVLLIGESLDEAAEDVRRFPVDAVYTVKAPDYAPIDHTARILEEVVKKRRPEMVFVFQSRSGDAITAYAASRLRAGFVIGATQVEVDTNERLAIITHQGSNAAFQLVSRMHARPQFISLQRGLFRTPLEDPYRQTSAHALDIKVAPAKAVDVLQKHDPPALTLENAERVVVAGSRVRNDADLALVRRLATRLDAVFGVTRSVVDRGLVQDESLVVSRLDRRVAPKLLVCVGNTGSLEFLDAVQTEPTIVAIASGPDDPINDRAAYRVEGSVKAAVEAVLAGV